MKSIFIISLLALSSSVFASNSVLDCRIIRMVDYTYFEESLSANEYPDFEIFSEEGNLSAHIGGNSYSADDGDQISLKLNNQKEIEAEVKTAHGDTITLTVERRTTMARATLKVKDNGQKSRTIGYALCDKGIL